MNIKLLSSLAKVPTKDKGNAGYDLYSIENYTLLPGERKLFKTGIAVSIPEGKYLQIFGRSGLAYKNGVIPVGGVLDESYRGEVGVILINTSFGTQAEPLKISIGDRIAQMVLLKYHEEEFIVVDDLDETNRGSNGFGSSGS